MKLIPILLIITTFFLQKKSCFCQTAAADNRITQSITFRPFPTGSSVLGIFQGRPPCAGLRDQLGLAIGPDCAKLKCGITLYRDSMTLQPTTWSMLIVGAGDLVQQEGGGAYRLGQLQGTWSIIKGMPSNPKATVYQLSLGKTNSYLYLLKGDDNVLFILDQRKEPIPGDMDFSYTLNRVEMVAGKK